MLRLPFITGDNKIDRNFAAVGENFTTIEERVPVNFMVTPKGGIAVKMKNESGVASVKGSLVAASPSTDAAFGLQTSSYDTFGVVYEDGVADGEDCFVIVSGIAELLIEDGEAITRGQVAIASAVDGRATAADIDHVAYGQKVAPDGASILNSHGTISSGSYTDLSVKDDVLMVVSEENDGSNVPGIDLQLTFTLHTGYVGTDVFVRGHYNGSTSHNIGVQAYNNTTAGWDSLDTMPHVTTIQNYTFGGLREDHVNASNVVKVRFLHNNTTGNTAHRLNLDQVYVLDGGQVVHNREVGHFIESKSSGTDVLAKAVIHFN